MSQPMRSQPAPPPAPQPAEPSAESPRPRALSASQVVDRIWDITRWKPLVLVSCVLDNRPKVSLQRLAAAIGDAAEIIVVTASEAWTLQRLVPHGFEAYGGAIRVVLPDASEQDPAERHPLFFTFDKDDPNDTVSRISSCLARNGFTRTKRCEHSPQPPATSRQQRRAEKLRDAKRTITRLEDENTSLTATLADLEAEKTALADQLRHAQTEIQTLTDQLDEATSPHPTVFSDPEEQLRHEIWLTWLSNTPEQHHDTQPLCDYSLGPDFLDSMSLQLVPRGRILYVVVDVLTRRVHQIPARRSHPLRTGEAGNAPQRTRDDGAAAWRCNLKTGKAGGPRLAWWQHPDGRIELGKAAHHDDFALR